MGIKTEILDGKGSGKSAKVDSSNALVVTDTGIPPEDVAYTLRPFSTFMTDSTGDEDMRVAGTLAAPVDYYIEAPLDGDRYVHTLAFTIADAGASLNEFGNLTALTNGCQLIYQDDEVGDIIIADSLKSNFDFVQACNFEPTFGTGAAAFLASNVVGTSEAYIPIMDIEDVFGMRYGLRLPQGTTKRLLLRVRDDTSTIDRFDVKCYGFDKVFND